MTSFLKTSTVEQTAAQSLAWLEMPADLLTPVRAFLALRAAGHRVCLLESAEGPDRIARWSFLGVDPEVQLIARRDHAVLTKGGEQQTIQGNPVDTLNQAMEFHAEPKADGSLELPPFVGGWVGWFAYEWASSLEPTVPVAGGESGPLAEFHLYRTVVAFDHATQKVVLLTSSSAESAEEDLQRLSEIARDLSQSPDTPAPFQASGEPRSSFGEAKYGEGVAHLREQIGEGEIFQAVLSQKFEQSFSGDPFHLYRALRLTNPAPHMFFFEGSEGTLVGSSPERLVSVVNDRVQNRPIAGTRARSADHDEDDRLGAELMGDQKERAEHDMLVDLARNDLGRIARTGSVAVKEHAVLEKFAQVQHLVSRVECDLAGHQTPMDALAASFPAGTVSGAPKVRAMQLIAELEPHPRGPYGGAFGYFDDSGNLDMAITIRSFIVKDGVVSVQAGAGVVLDSTPEREHAETLEKSKALFDALNLASSGLFDPKEGNA
ncbi:MAG: chorismate-binding protein [Planctomycetes bacterium]|nr:chorismate-binding protein [Planctomycetota bacterium]